MTRLASSRPLAVLSVLVAFCAARPAAAQEGDLDRTNFQHVGCSIASMHVHYRLGSLMGEPMVNGGFAWNAAPGTDANCLPYTVHVALRVESGSQTRWITLDPTVPASGESGYNVAGSPSWDAVLCDVDGSSCLAAADARDFWRNGMSVTGFQLVGGEEQARAREEAKVKEARRLAAAQQAERERAEREDAARRQAEADARAEEAAAAERARVAHADSVEAERRQASLEQQTALRERQNAAKEAHDAEEARRKAAAEARNDSLVAAGDRIARTADDVENGEIADQTEEAASNLVTGFGGMASQFLSDGFYVGLGLVSTRMNVDDLVLSANVWSPRRFRIDMMINTSQLFQDVDEALAEDSTVGHMTMAFTGSIALDFWSWLGVYSNPDWRGFIPYPTVTGGVASGDWDGEYGHWAGVYGFGAEWGGPKMPLLIALDFLYIDGKDPGTKSSYDGWSDRDNMMVELSVGTNFKF